jgi:hypothetical protein
MKIKETGYLDSIYNEFDIFHQIMCPKLKLLTSNSVLIQNHLVFKCALFLETFV